MSGPLFSTRKRLAEEALASHPQHAAWSERDRAIFRAGAMMGVTRGYDLADRSPRLRCLECNSPEIVQTITGAFCGKCNTHVFVKGDFVGGTQ